jgi:hypothetical protein
MLQQKLINRDAVKDLAGLARQTAGRREVLFHGTRHAKSILMTGVLFYSASGEPGVFFTCSPETAAHAPRRPPPTGH